MDLLSAESHGIISRHEGATGVIKDVIDVTGTSNFGSMTNIKGNILWSNFNSGLITTLEGFSTNILGTINSPENIIRAITTDGTNLIIISTGAGVNGTVYAMVGETSVVDYSFESDGHLTLGATVIGGNLITSVSYPFDRIFEHTGITVGATYFASPNTTPSGLTSMDDANLISTDYAANLIYLHVLITAAIASSFATPSAGTSALTSYQDPFATEVYII